MRYLGGKAKNAQEIKRVVRTHQNGCARLVEPFMGGGNASSVLAPMFKTVELGDVQEDLILMWQALQKGWEPPLSISVDEYYELKNQSSSALRGLVGFGGSFGGKWFAGYAHPSHNRNYYDEARRGVLREVQNFQHANITLKSYQEHIITPDTLVYCDPPYQNTTAYQGNENAFNHEEFWQVMNDWTNKGAIVLVSEYSAPSEWIACSESEKRVTVSAGDNKKIAVEKVFMRKDILEKHYTENCLF